MLSEEPVEGLLLAGAYRDTEVDAAHPLAAMLGRWSDQAGVRQVQLDNLAVPSLETMAAEMLHVERATATGLVEVINERTSGNPYETVELLNALQREGVLTATATGWRWDDATARARLGQSEVARMLAARVEAMPATSRALVEAMACLGGRAEASLLQTATAASAGVVEQQLAPALDEGVLVVEPGLREAVRFRHDRTREVILRELDPQRRHELQLAVARRLAGEPELYAVAAEQYLPVIDAVADAAERRLVVGLLRRAADQAALIGEYALVNALLTAALRADRARGDRHVDRGAHRPPRRPVQPGAAGRGGRGVPRDRAPVSRRDPTCRRDGRAGEQPDPPQTLQGSDRSGPGVAG